MKDHDDVFAGLTRDDVELTPRISTDFHAAVLTGTEEVLARRRALRTACAVGAVLILMGASFTAGRATAAAAAESAPPEPAAAGAPDGAPELVDLAHSTPAELKAVGDQLAREGDIESALACYRRFLDAAPEEGRRLHPDDGWLLASLKLDLE